MDVSITVLPKTTVTFSKLTSVQFVYVTMELLHATSFAVTIQAAQ